jgi:hypothetical protein
LLDPKRKRHLEKYGVALEPVLRFELVVVAKLRRDGDLSGHEIEAEHSATAATSPLKSPRIGDTPEPLSAVNWL